jgi:hypothetical protein
MLPAASRKAHRYRGDRRTDHQTLLHSPLNSFAR